MNAAQHTPVPWFTDEKDHDEPYQNIKVKAGNHHTVCTVWIDDAPVREFNSWQRANARLIAAAPDLLEALTALTANLDEGDFISTTRIDAAKAAIAKAGS